MGVLNAVEYQHKKFFALILGIAQYVVDLAILKVAGDSNYALVPTALAYSVKLGLVGEINSYAFFLGNIYDRLQVVSSL